MNKDKVKIENEEMGIYLKVINLDYPHTNIAEKAKLISDTFGVECTEEEINIYHNLQEIDYEPDWEWLSDIKNGR